MLPTRRSEFAAGVRAQLPLLAGVAPFGMAYGALAVESGLSPGFAQAMSVIVFGGASQVAAVQAIEDGVAGGLVVLIVMLINTRHALYAASLAPHVAHLPLRVRMLIAYLLTDEAYAIGITRYDRDQSPVTSHRPPGSALDDGHPHWFLLGGCVALWVCWQVTTALGVFAGAAVPESWALDFALPLTFIAIVVPALSDRASLAAAVVAGAVAVAGYRWPHGTGVICAALAGIAAGVIAARLSVEPGEASGEAEAA